MINFTHLYLGIFSLFISALSFLNILYCYYFKLYLNINNFIFIFIVSLLLGSVIFFNKKNIKKISIYQKILTVVLGYVAIPILLSIPYYLIINKISYIDSYFEAISGFTSTGFTIFNNLKHLDESLLLWRSSTQWLGGLYFLISIILLIDIFDKNLKKSLTNFINFNSNETIKQCFKISIVYMILTITIFAVLYLSDLRAFNSFNLSLTLISSGGFLPVNNLDTIINTKFKEIVLSAMMLLSFFSLFFTYNLVFFHKRNINFFSEDLYLGFYLIFLVSFFFLFLNIDDNFSSLLLAICSSISNIGFSLNVPKDLSFIFLILIIIGGSFFSTSSGIRFFKLLLLFKFSINELVSHSKPKSLFTNKLSFFNLSFSNEDFYKYFVSVIIFILSLSILSLMLTISGINSEDAFRLSILTLMNTVNSFTSGINNFTFYDLSLFSKLSLMFFMIIGRVELISILIICKKFFFKT
ncbi:potassium transporter Trk [Candidatus Pelagibacter communis]|uniref:potassium transporter Trk n=1 Tax=Pelagibacter ubique TaxID=198252 RepID=UPI00094D015B|nr:potassium transporter Trk [Candidatus Pelagibacter ubique]